MPSRREPSAGASDEPGMSPMTKRLRPGPAVNHAQIGRQAVRIIPPTWAVPRRLREIKPVYFAGPLGGLPGGPTSPADQDFSPG